jgi:uncharacterized protein
MTVQVTNQMFDSRYEATIDKTFAGAAWYELDQDVITFTHTAVESAFGGQGVGGKLARFALDDARERGLRVVARCPFIRRWIRRHPEYTDLLVKSR